MVEHAKKSAYAWDPFGCGNEEAAETTTVSPIHPYSQYIAIIREFIGVSKWQDRIIFPELAHWMYPIMNWGKYRAVDAYIYHYPGLSVLNLFISKKEIWTSSDVDLVRIGIHYVMLWHHLKHIGLLSAGKSSVYYRMC